jgi:hypothetical protein
MLRAMEEPRAPTRRVIQAEALAWLAGSPADPGASVVTSMPDVSELEGHDLAAWRAWFEGAARALLRWVPDEGVAIFFQSDVRHDGAWIDKGYLVQRAAEDVGARLVWHKIVCRHPPGSISLGRPTYSHMLCFSRSPRSSGRRPGPDVIADAGAMTWSRAMGLGACRVACRFLRDETATTVVVDPFCGRGSVLAVANAMGLDAIGVELSPKRCRAARNLVVDADLAIVAGRAPA